MKYFRKTVTSIFLILLVLPFQCFSQNQEQKDSTNQLLMTVAREIMAAAGNCALITIDEKDRTMVRTMDPFLPESDFTVWFGTNSKSRKVDQIKKNPTVTLYYFYSELAGYVVIHGKAELVNDQKEKEKRWKTAWEAFYPNKTEDYLLIKVTPEWMEVLSNVRGIFGDSQTWEAPVLHFDSIN